MAELIDLIPPVTGIGFIIGTAVMAFLVGRRYERKKNQNPLSK